MTQEEKAKRYDESITNGSRLWECGLITRETYETIFPELAESEDEKIKNFIRLTLEEKYVVDGIVNSVDADNAFAWLEKVEDKIKSLHWKPSELDIDLLEGIANGKYNPKDFQASLGCLIVQLKKLKENEI